MFHFSALLLFFHHPRSLEVLSEMETRLSSKCSCRLRSLVFLFPLTYQTCFVAILNFQLEKLANVFKPTELQGASKWVKIVLVPVEGSFIALEDIKVWFLFGFSLIMARCSYKWCSLLIYNLGSLFIHRAIPKAFPIRLLGDVPSKEDERFCRNTIKTPV